MLLTIDVNGHNCVAVRHHTTTGGNAAQHAASRARIVRRTTATCAYDLCGMLRPSTYDDAVCVNAAVEINLLDYNVAVHSVNRL